jgi:hypothetical protein
MQRGEMFARRVTHIDPEDIGTGFEQSLQLLP